jgi:hypothetical protein
LETLWLPWIELFHVKQLIQHTLDRTHSSGLITRPLSSFG